MNFPVQLLHRVSLSSVRCVQRRRGRAPVFLPVFHKTISRALSSHTTPGNNNVWTFPQPPPPPSDQELRDNGLPILHQASLHASQGRILLSGWTHEDGSVDIVSYKDILSKARLVSETILQNKSEDADQRNLIAHLNVPGWEYVATQWGAWGAGYGSVPLALTQKTAEIEHVLEQANPRFIFAGGNCAFGQNNSHESPNVQDLFRAAENVGMRDRVVSLNEVMNQQSTDNDVFLGGNGVVKSLDDTALLLFTSGTTGKPKAAVLTHRNIYHQVTDLVSAWEWQPTDVAIHVLPLHHVHGVINLLSCAAYVGARLEFQPFDAKTLWQQWASSVAEPSKPTANILMAVPTIYAKLLEAAHNLPKETIDAAVRNTLSPMRLMVSGSAALPVSVLEKWKKLTGHTLLERYGMTEFAMALSNPYKEEPQSSDEDGNDNRIQKRRPGYVGRPLPSVQVRLVNPDTQKEIHSPGISGELQVKGPTVFQRYLNRSDATKEAFAAGGYFKTGDIAQYDGGNIQSYRILGRASVDIIKTGGHKLSALEIEREILEHPDVAEAAVLGIPDEMWGERVSMVYRLKPGAEPLTLDGLRDFCSDRLSKEKVPSRLLHVEEIPKNAMGKVNKKNLAELFEQGFHP